MEYIKHQSKAPDGRLLAIGHSMGGILLYAMLSKCSKVFHFSISIQDIVLYFFRGFAFYLSIIISCTHFFIVIFYFIVDIYILF